MRRPYTFIVLAILIVLFGGLAAVRTPTDIFPDIKIPVIAAVWTYSGLSPDEMAGRVIYYYERQLSTSVNDIDHVETNRCRAWALSRYSFILASIFALPPRRSRPYPRQC